MDIYSSIVIYLTKIILYPLLMTPNLFFEAQLLPICYQLGALISYYHSQVYLNPPKTMNTTTGHSSRAFLKTKLLNNER
jgi:hypothetical protein